MPAGSTHRLNLTKSAILYFATAYLSLGAVAVADEADPQFKEAYYQQTHEQNYSAAAAAYEKVIADPTAPEALRAEAKTRLAQCREDQAADNLAQLMPS